MEKRDKSAFVREGMMTGSMELCCRAWVMACLASVLTLIKLVGGLERVTEGGGGSVPMMRPINGMRPSSGCRTKLANVLRTGSTYSFIKNKETLFVIVDDEYVRSDSFVELWLWLTSGTNTRKSTMAM